VNARASTGPQTAQGRARAARNALRHALSLPVCFNPAFSEEVETLAHEIAGPDANAQTQGLARQVADAQIVCVACGMPAINSYPAHWPSQLFPTRCAEEVRNHPPPAAGKGGIGRRPGRT
jgi:hypothetical protein